MCVQLVSGKGTREEMCLCVCVLMCVCVCVCMCMCGGETRRKRERESQREKREECLCEIRRQHCSRPKVCVCASRTVRYTDSVVERIAADREEGKREREEGNETSR